MAQRLVAGDATVTITPGGPDDGQFTAGTAVTLRFRRARFEFDNQLVDVTAASDNYVFNRIAHKDFTVTCEGLVHTTNTNYPDITYLAFNNALARLTCTLIGSGKTVTVDGVVRSLRLDVDEPDTERIVIKPYGIDPVLA
jgi:hypothetical protein